MKIFEDKEAELEFIKWASVMIAAGHSASTLSIDIESSVDKAIALRNELKKRSIENTLLQ
jgi:hypothetical protein